jgi:hypothetical protein
MSEKKETYIEMRKICPLRLLAVAVYKSGEAECIGKECAWYLICYNFSNLAEILARTHDTEAI